MIWLRRDGPVVVGCTDRDQLVSNLQAVYETAKKDPGKYADDRLFVFEGRKLRITGNPYREITFTDGVRVGLSTGPDYEDATDPDSLIPPSWYGG
jgi:hypothetical protein